jgi:hypothetical protein
MKFYYLPKIAGSGFRIVGLPDTLRGLELKEFLWENYQYHHSIYEIVYNDDDKGLIYDYDNPDYDG